MFILALLLTGCGGDPNRISQAELVEIQEKLDEFEVKQTIDEQSEDDFVFRLVSEKEEYRPEEPVELYGEIIHTGDEEITIVHGSPAIMFRIEEQIRGHEFAPAIREVAIYSPLMPNDPFRQEFMKQGIFYSEELHSEEYIAFIEDLLERDGFPPGYYTVKATTAFYDGTMHREIEAEVDFKVLTGTNGDSP